MKANFVDMLILVGVGMVVGTLLGFGLSCITPPPEEQVSVTKEIQEEEMEMIGKYECGFMIINKLHDNRDNVTCWVYIGGHGGGISCIPDHMLTP